MNDRPVVKPAKPARSGFLREALMTLGVIAAIGAGIQLIDSAPYNYTLERDCSVCPEVIKLPRGVTTIGAETEQPRLQLTLSHELWVGRFPVMVGEYRLFAAAEPAQAGDAWRNPGFAQDDSHPVVMVSWHEAVAYAKWLYRHPGGRPYRLLSEAEWEYAARGGQLKYWDDAPQDSGRRAPKAGTTTLTPLAKDGANNFGLVAMLGHVRQWTLDCWNPTLAGQPDDGSPRDKTGDCSQRVQRGGSFADPAAQMRASARMPQPSTARSPNVGFRIARTK
jgi:formylglycine-generating enzyme required for sulfatase activity